MSGKIKHDDMGLVYLGMIGVVIGGLFFVWYHSHTKIVYYGLKYSWYLLSVFDWQFMPDIIKKWRHEAAYLAQHANKITFSQFLDYMNKVGSLFVVFPILLTAQGIKKAHTHKSNKTRRKITIETLPWIMSKHSPAIIPVLYYGDKHTLLLNTDPIEHRSSINPEEFVAENGLLVNGQLNKQRCHQLLASDLNKPIENINELSSIERVFFAIFASRIFGKGKDQKVAQDLLDKLNRSCHTHTWQGKKGYPDLSITDKVFETYSVHPEVKNWLHKHPYPRTLLHSMHKIALMSGKLPSSHFRWLKGMDRGLFYALNTTGRKGPFIESAAVFTQALWEDFAFEYGYKLTEPAIAEAIDGLENYLIKIGLVATK